MSSSLDNLPEISLISEEEQDIETIMQNMIQDFEDRYQELMGEELTLTDSDPWAIMCFVAAGQFYQGYAIAEERMKQNFLKYMYGDSLKNWGGNFGMTQDGTAYATTVLKFTLSDAQPVPVTIPAGTRATAGDDIYFATDNDIVIAAGNLEGVAKATCTTAGTIGNQYVTGMINIITDPVNLVDSVTNTEDAKGGHDEYTDDERRELIFNFPSTYSSAGPEQAYTEFVKLYSSAITNAVCVTTEDSTVQIYIMLENATVPSTDYCSKVHTYLMNLGVTPDTDNVIILPPTTREYSLDITYYISESNKETEDSIKESVEAAIEEWIIETDSDIGGTISTDDLISYIKAAGAKRAVIASPSYTKVENTEVALCTSREVTYGGLEA